ncbi:hypothetical protein ACQPZJ_28745 [Actinoplanes sp. CA-054009]
MSLAGITGCSSDSGPVMTVEEAGQTYLELSDASNAAREAWMYAPPPTTKNLADHKRLASAAADATVTFSRGLREHRWPSQAQPSVTALDAQLQERASAYRLVAETDTLPDYLAAAAQVPVTTSLTADVRTALGLPQGAAVSGAAPS